MGANTAASVEDYLRTSFPDLDREYRDGEIVERTLPDSLHSRTQALLAFFFEALRKRFPVYVYPELRVKRREGLILIPDICVYWPERPLSRLPDTPPLVAIEILLADDRLAAVRDKFEEYRVWGVKYVWLVDRIRGECTPTARDWWKSPRCWRQRSARSLRRAMFSRTERIRQVPIYPGGRRIPGGRMPQPRRVYLPGIAPEQFGELL